MQLLATSTLILAALTLSPDGPPPQDSGPHPAVARLGDREAAAWIADGQACFALRLDEPRETVRVISAVQEDLTRIDGSDVWFGAFDIERSDEVVMGVRFVFVEDGRFETGPTLPPLRGPKAPPAPQRAEPLAGEIVEHEIGDAILGRLRTVWVYRPPGFEADAIEQVVFMADGGATERYATVLEPLVSSGAIPPTAIVGADNGGADPAVPGPEGDRRAHEYLAGYAEFVSSGDLEAYDRHWTFFTDFLPAWAREELGLEGEPILFGVSNGAAFCGSVAGRLPERFPAAILCSVAWENTGDSFTATEATQRLFVTGGILEPRFLEESRAVEAAAREQGRVTRLVEAVGGHDSAVWQDQFAAGLIWLASETERPSAAE
ncbi:MAG: alpha/beta hydrolase-fold protein [Planctomycetota bacterium]